MIANGGRGIWVIVPAAGVGQRMDAELPKQYLPIHGEPMLLHTLRALAAHTEVAGIQLALSDQDAHWPQMADGCRAVIACPIHETTGGETRAASVLAALAALPDSVEFDDWVLVHDAARPCIALEDLDRLIAELVDETDGAILAAPIADTVKQSGDVADRIERTLPRETLWRALTPQAARRQSLADALTKAMAANHPVTDEASALEFAGLRPRLVPGRADNLKVTSPDDLRLAAMLLTRS